MTVTGLNEDINLQFETFLRELSDELRREEVLNFNRILIRFCQILAYLYRPSKLKVLLFDSRFSFFEDNVMPTKLRVLEKSIFYEVLTHNIDPRLLVKYILTNTKPENVDSKVYKHKALIRKQEDLILIIIVHKIFNALKETVNNKAGAALLHFEWCLKFILIIRKEWSWDYHHWLSQTLRKCEMITSFYILELNLLNKFSSFENVEHKWESITFLQTSVLESLGINDITWRDSKEKNLWSQIFQTLATSELHSLLYYSILKKNATEFKEQVIKFEVSEELQPVIKKVIISLTFKVERDHTIAGLLRLLLFCLLLEGRSCFRDISFFTQILKRVTKYKYAVDELDYLANFDPIVEEVLGMNCFSFRGLQNTIVPQLVLKPIEIFNDASSSLQLLPCNLNDYEMLNETSAKLSTRKSNWHEYFIECCISHDSDLLNIICDVQKDFRNL